MILTCIGTLDFEVTLHTIFKCLTCRSSAVQKVADKGYVQARINNDDYTFNDCYEHREIMAHHKKKMMSKADKETLFPLKGGKEVPGAYDRYDCEEASKLNRLVPIIDPTKTKAHDQVPYLRASPLQGVVEYLQKYMITPIAVKKKDMPQKVAWNNFPSVLYPAHAVYCALEGLLHLISSVVYT